MDIGNYKVLTAKEEQALSEQWLTKNDEVALNKLISHNVRFVISVAGKFSRNTHALIDFDDLVQEGISQGLYYAARKFDWRRKFRFTTYAFPWIANAMMRYIARNHSPVHVATRAAHEMMFCKNKKGAYSEESLRSINMNVHMYLDEQIHTNKHGTANNDTKGDNFPDTSMSVEQQVINNFERRWITEQINNLKPRSRMIIKKRFADDKVLQEIGDELGVSRERIRQLQDEALAELRMKARRT